MRKTINRSYFLALITVMALGSMVVLSHAGDGKPQDIDKKELVYFCRAIQETLGSGFGIGSDTLFEKTTKITRYYHFVGPEGGPYRLMGVTESPPKKSIVVFMMLIRYLDEVRNGL